MELKPGNHFKLASQTKRLMATILNDQERAAYKRAMIQAQLQGALVLKKEKGKPEDNSGE